jgi:DNA-binding NarL/FixJ family response regulator
VIFEAPARESHLLEAFRLDVCGYVCSGAQAPELLRAIREAAHGRRYVSPPFARRGAEIYFKKARAHPDTSYEDLTPRERDVVILAAQGLTSGMIGERLGIGRRTAESHRASGLRKLGIANQTELVLYALRHGIVTLDRHSALKPGPRLAP